MNTNKEQLDKLAEKFFAGNANAQEKDELHQQYDINNEDGDEIINLSANETKDDIKQRIFQNIQVEIQKSAPVKKKFKHWFSLSAAALLAITTGIGIYYYHIADEYVLKAASTKSNTIAPGSNNATLLLANGIKINLNDVPEGNLVNKNGISITKTANGQVVYSIADQSSSTKNQLEYNTISTPKGGKYQINLPDGTKVWLNAASSLKFPLSFNGTNKRNVILDGEAYFEVAPNKKQPFSVVSANQIIEVLGTHFNVNSYADENTTKTTLVEGTVRVNSLNKSAFSVLKPGQQSILEEDKMTIKEIDTDDVISWKNGYFSFHKEPMTSAMRKLARWYNVEIVYADNVDDITFEGSFPCADSLEKTLKILEFTGSFKFKVEGRRLIVML